MGRQTEPISDILKNLIQLDIQGKHLELKETISKLDEINIGTIFQECLVQSDLLYDLNHIKYLFALNLNTNEVFDIMKIETNNLDTWIRCIFGIAYDHFYQVFSPKLSLTRSFEIIRDSIKLAEDNKTMTTHRVANFVSLISLLLDPEPNYPISPILLTREQYYELYHSIDYTDIKNIIALALKDPKLCEESSLNPLNDFEIQIRLVKQASSSQATFYFIQHYERLLLTDQEKLILTQFLSLEHLHSLVKQREVIPKSLDSISPNKLLQRVYSNIRVNLNRYIEIQTKLFSSQLETLQNEVENFIEFCIRMYMDAFDYNKTEKKWNWVFSMQITKLFNLVTDDSILEKYWARDEWLELDSSKIIQEGILSRIQSPLLVTKLYEYRWENQIEAKFTDDLGEYVPPNLANKKGLDRIFKANCSINQNMKSWEIIRSWDIPESYYFQKFNEAIRGGDFALAKFCEPATQNKTALIEMAKNQDEDDLARYTAIILLNDDKWFEYGFLQLKTFEFQRALLDRINKPMILVKLRLVAENQKWSVLITEKVQKLRTAWMDQLFQI